MSELEIQVGETRFRVQARQYRKVGSDSMNLAEFFHVPCGQWFARFGPLQGKQSAPNSWLTHPCPGITPFDVLYPRGRELWRAVWEQGERLRNGKIR